MWSVGQAQDYINKRVEKHRAEAANPPVCNKKERWQRDASFAVMRTDRKRALRLYQNKDQAEAALIHAAKIAPPGDAKKFYIEERAAEPVRCLDFCGVQLQCDFGTEAEKKWKEKHGSGSGNHRFCHCGHCEWRHHSFNQSCMALDASATDLTTTTVRTTHL
jgi:hypothetical protein